MLPTPHHSLRLYPPMNPHNSKGLLPTPHMRPSYPMHTMHNPDQTLMKSAMPDMYCAPDPIHKFKTKIEHILNFKIKNVSLYQQAFTHKSLMGEIKVSNERLEFLGDSVLGMVIAEYVYHRFNNENEGFLTKLRSKLVNCDTLTYIAKKIELHTLLVTSRQVSEEGKLQTKLLEDSFEALIGALYLDLGWEYAQQFIVRIMEEHINFSQILIDDNYKDILLKHTQKMNLGLPKYVDIDCSGPPHDRVFVCSVEIGNEEMGRASGKTKKQAEKFAAKSALDKYKVDLTQTIRNTTPRVMEH